MKQLITFNSILTLLFVLIVGSSVSLAQTITVTGIITDADRGEKLPGVNVLVKGTNIGTNSDLDGVYSISFSQKNATLVFSFIGMQKKEVLIKEETVVDVALHTDVRQLSEVVVSGYGDRVKSLFQRKSNDSYNYSTASQPQQMLLDFDGFYSSDGNDTEEYESEKENTFLTPQNNPLSTFSIDVDAASYTNVRRFINNGQRPPADAVRVEEMINYFDYSYNQPSDHHPFSIQTEVSNAPWNEKHQLVHIGIQGKSIPTEDLPASNLVFLIDVSGSMSAQNKLPLLKAGFKMLTEKLRAEDKVSIVVYAGAAGCVLPPTSGDEKKKIMNALNKLQAGGSTAGGAGINLAYQLAKEQFIAGGNNRIILATDGDFNVGASSNDSMEELIEQKRKEGVFLTVLGFGMGNYKDSKMEILADKGNGNYAYIDNMLEAKKVLVNEFGGTLFTIAKDVKIQVEFNPANVTAYRLIGYENRKLAAEDFNNDKKDAGELGSGHAVTALYEIIPTGVDSYFKPIDDLKYQKPVEEVSKNKKDYGNELFTVKFRYKAPDGNTSKLIVHTVENEAIALKNTSDNFRWSAAVATFGMLLTDSNYLEEADYEMVLSLAKEARGVDEKGYRVEFMNMVETCQLLAEN